MTAVDEITSGRLDPCVNIRTVSAISGAYLFVPRPHRDGGGFVSRSLDTRWLLEAGLDPHAFVQDGVCRTRQGVIRGMHLRREPGGGRLVRCTRGVVFSVIVDLRRRSSTFRNVFAAELRADPPVTLYVPPGCADGFQSLTEPADVTYRIDHGHDPAADLTVDWDDPDLAIEWPLRPTTVHRGNRPTPSLSTVLDFLP